MDAKTNIGYALIRVFLGLALSIRGWMILSNPNSIIELGVGREYFMWVSLIGIVHLLGGLLLCLGILARLGAVIQIPILFVAIFFSDNTTNFFDSNNSINNEFNSARL